MALGEKSILTISGYVSGKTVIEDFADISQNKSVMIPTVRSKPIEFHI